MATAQRNQYHRYGGPEVLRLEGFEPARPTGHQVLVRVKAAAANPMDWGIRQGRLKMATGRVFPRGLGHDLAGIVEAVGSDVTRLRVGDEVFGGAGLKESGAYAEYVVTGENWLVQKPAQVSWEEGAAIPVAGGTAYQALVTHGKLRAGQAVFVTGCLGGVGRAATQIAQMLGAKVGGSCRDTAAPDARALGIAPVVGFDFDARKLQGQFDLVLDTAGALSRRAARTLIKPGGRILDIQPNLTKFLRSALPGSFTVVVGKPVVADLEALARAAENGDLRMPIARTVPLRGAIAALTELELHGTPKGGKLVVTND